MVLDAVDAEPGGPSLEGAEPAPLRKTVELDPGWLLAEARATAKLDAIALVAESPWWPALSEAGADALSRLWRHGVAVGMAARRLAREAGESDPARIARAGMLSGMGRWAVAALEPDWLPAWLAEPDPRRRRELERRLVGTDLTTLGRDLAERWGCDPLVADAAWLHADLGGTLNGGASEPDRLRLIQQAYSWAERTPWALHGREEREPGPSDPRLRILIAEVQVRCGGPFIESDATPHEERRARSNARLLLRISSLLAGNVERDRFLEALAASDPSDDPDTWAERAGLAWCGGPGVATARVVWTGPRPLGNRTLSGEEVLPPSPPADRPPTRRIVLADRGRPCAEVHLWTEDEAPPASPEIQSLWNAWAAIVAERARVGDRLGAVVDAHRDQVASEGPRLRKSKLDALAEFAAGAGHEMNNPLAVVVGRAQLLLARETDPVAVRSLRAILHQAQRAHRILRDLMYVARPPELRPRFCQPEELVRACLRDFRAEAEARGARLTVVSNEPDSKVWADPDALRHLLETLVRNALEATPKGGTIQIKTSGDARMLKWSVQDSGRGITPEEGPHLFDPFYCGRQAGRGLGLGLPRAARVIAQAGGELRWHSSPGQGSLFQVHLPLAEAPRPLSRTDLGPSTARNEPPSPSP